MPMFNGKGIEEGSVRELIPIGDYPSRIIKIGEKTTKAGDPMWNVELEIFNSEHAGRHFWDNWVWNEKTENRIKLILHRCGFDTEVGDVNYTPDQFIGKEMLVTLLDEEYNGETRNKVAMFGYDYYDNGTNDTPKEDDDLPF